MLQPASRTVTTQRRRRFFATTMPAFATSGICFATMTHRCRQFEDSGAAPTSNALLQALRMMLQPASNLLQPASPSVTTHRRRRFFSTTTSAIATTGIFFCYHAPLASVFLLQLRCFFVTTVLPFATTTHRRRRKSCDRQLVFAGTGGDFCCGWHSYLLGR